MAYHRTIPRITADDAETEARPLFVMPDDDLPADLGKVKTMDEPTNQPRAYAGRTYTIHAVSPQGFPIDLSFADISIAMLEQHIGKLITAGYTPPTQVAAAAAPLATPDDLPEGWKLCQRHGAPMRPRNKQNQNWHSHNVGTKDSPVWCKGYKGADSPGYDVE